MEASPLDGFESVATNDLIPESGWINRFIAITDGSSEAPRSSYLAASIALLSGLFGPQMPSLYGIHHKEYCHLWVLLRGPSAVAKKTTVMGAARSVFNMIERKLGGMSQLISYDSIDASQVSSAALAERWGAKDEEQAATWERERPPARFVDANEAAPFFGSGRARESANAGNVRNSMLRIYDGEIVSTTRSTSVPWSPVSIGMLGTTTATAMRERLGRNNEASVSSGFLARWLFVDIDAVGAPMVWPEMNGRAPKIELLVDPLAELIRHGGVAHNMYEQATEAAVAARTAWYEPQWYAWQSRAIESNDPVDLMLASVWGRWQASAFKLACLHALSRQYDRIEQISQVMIDEEDVAWGQRFIDNCMLQAHALLNEDVELVPSRHAEQEGRIIAYVREAGGSATIRELHQRLRKSMGVGEILSVVEFSGAFDVQEAGRGRTVVTLNEGY